MDTRSYNMSYALVFAFALILVALPSKGSGPEPPWVEARLNPRVGVGPLTVRIEGYISSNYPSVGFYYGHIRFGDGSEWGECKYGSYGSHIFIPLDLDHEFTCPGTYVVRIFGWVLDISHEQAVVEASVTVLPPSFVLTTESLSERTVRLITMDNIQVTAISETVVDWGEGGPSEAINWQAVGSAHAGLAHATPYHVYSDEGVYRVTVVNKYVGEHCSFDESSIIDVSVGNATPVLRTSWGMVKKLYR